MNDKNINVGLASFGMSGKVFHAPIIEQNPNFNLKLIVERSKTNSKKIYPTARIVTDFCELLNSPEIDLIVINTPTYLHFEMAKQALLAGKHIVLEKPMTATSLEAEELIKIAENKNLVIAVYHSK
ncbi:MAG: Gfo/Idh/MocA family oxidoreductase, partial [Cyclobacteriaceae bacterium]|nr:Gfo/Idh/MocA family oxidoreductase [Cyclobacteriaceae bacterium]